MLKFYRSHIPVLVWKFISQGKERLFLIQCQRQRNEREPTLLLRNCLLAYINNPYINKSNREYYDISYMYKIYFNCIQSIHLFLSPFLLIYLRPLLLPSLSLTLCVYVYVCLIKFTSLLKETQ